MKLVALACVLALSGCFSKPGFRGGSGDAGGDGSIVPPMTLSSKLSAGNQHACLIDTDGRLFCWGKNDRGQLGAIATGTATGTPVQATTTAGWTWVSAGEDFTCGVQLGHALCWGRNDHGQSSPTAGGSDVAIGTAITLPTNEVVSKVFAGVGSACAITTSGATYCWGNL